MKQHPKVNPGASPRTPVHGWPTGTYPTYWQYDTNSYSGLLLSTRAAHVFFHVSRETKVSLGDLSNLSRTPRKWQIVRPRATMFRAPGGPESPDRPRGRPHGLAYTEHDQDQGAGLEGQLVHAPNTIT